MKVLMVLPDKYEEGGVHGIKVFVRSLGEALSERGHEVHILCKRAEAGEMKAKSANGLFIHTYRPIKPHKFFDPLLLYLNAKQVVREHNIDVVQLNGIWYSLLINLFLEKPKIVTVHSSIKKCYSSWLKKFVLKVSLKNATRVHLVAKFIKKELVEATGLGEEKMVTIYHGVDPAKFATAKHSEKRKINEAFGIRESYPIIICVSALRPKQKRQDLLIKASRIIAKTYPTHKILLIGPGKQEPYLKLIRKVGVEDNVILIGPVAHEKLAPYLAISHIFAFPTDYEGLGLAVIEAISAGLPIVASNIPPLREVVNKKMGFLVENRPEEFAKAILKLAENKKLIKNISNTCKKRAKMFSWKKSTKQIEDVMVSIKE